MTSNMINRYLITTHAKLPDGEDCILSSHSGGPCDDAHLMKIAKRAKISIMACWPDWVPQQDPIVKMNWLHEQSMIFPI